MPTYPSPFLKLTFGGTQADGQDEWNCGINLAMENDAAVPILPVDAVRAFELYEEDIDPDIVSIISNYVSNPVMDIPTAATLDYIKLAVIGTDGMYLADSVIWEPEDVTGASASGYIPQVSLVMTLQTNKRSDPGKFGRFYLPTDVPFGSTNYRPTNLEAKAELTANVLAALDRELSPLVFPVHVFPAAVTSSEKFSGQYRPFTQVKVGNVYDTQRRRRNRIPETYYQVPIPDTAVVEPLDDTPAE